MRAMALLLVLLAVCAAGPDESCALERVAELSLQMVLGTVPSVTADINGHAANLVLDTGSNATVLTTVAANRLGVAWKGAPLPVTGAGGMAQAFVTRVPSFVLGEDVTSDMRVLVAQGLPPMIDGVIGIDVLSDYEVDLDVPHRRLVLYRARFCPDASPPWTAPFTQLAVEQQQSGHLFTPVELDGRPVFGLLDTGASATVVGLSAAQDAGVTEAALQADPAQNAYSLAGNGIAIRQRRFQTLKIGDDVLEKPALYVADLPSFMGGLVIGSGYLATRRVWLSFGTGQVFVTSSDQP